MKYQSQQGVALITILLVVVIATILGVSMTTAQKFAISRARSFFDQGIVRQYAYGGEELARQILHEDFLDAPEVDHRSENWASPDLKFEFEEGEVELLIEDLQGKFNLNSLQGLMPDQKASGTTTTQLARLRLNNLLSQVGMDRAFTDRIVDWIDRDEQANPLGAEDFDYLGLDRPYRTGGQTMVDVSELRLILGMTREQYDAISPYLTVLPETGSTINVNTASPEILQLVAPGLSSVESQNIVIRRDENLPFNTVNEFTGDPSIPNASSIKAGTLSVQSSFFQVTVRARYQDRFGYLTSVIQRNPTDGSMRVIYRDQSKKIMTQVVEEPTDNG